MISSPINWIFSRKEKSKYVHDLSKSQQKITQNPQLQQENQTYTIKKKKQKGKKSSQSKKRTNIVRRTTSNKKDRSKFSKRGGAACGLVDVEEGVAWKRGEGCGAAEGVLGGLLEEFVDVVRLDVRPPCLLPLPRALRRLPHPLFLCSKSFPDPENLFCAIDGAGARGREGPGFYWVVLKIAGGLIRAAMGQVEPAPWEQARQNHFI